MEEVRIKSFEMGDAISAAIIPSKKYPHSHTGDAIYIDAQQKIFAVADGPDKNPLASLHFLNRFKKAMDEADLDGRYIESFEDVVDAANSLMRDTPYHESTTFSSLFFGQNGKAGLLHTGDSLIFQISALSGECKQLSRTNHLLVGRAPHLYQTGIIPFERHDMIILATDGITDLARSHGSTPQKFLSNLVSTLCPSEIMLSILHHIHKVEVRLDDIGIIISIPEKIIGNQEKCPNVILTN